jgi:hypothetical protein
MPLIVPLYRRFGAGSEGTWRCALDRLKRADFFEKHETCPEFELDRPDDAPTPTGFSCGIWINGAIALHPQNK